MEPAAKKQRVDIMMENSANDDKHGQDSKPSAKLSSSSKQDTPVTAEPLVDANAWRGVLERIPRCNAVEGIRETSHFKNSITGNGRSGCNGCLKHLLQELYALENSLPTQPAIWLRFDEETPQFLRALITGPCGTPYSHGLFAFDIYVPDSYPLESPKMQFLTTGGGKVCFGPNLYANGKVCLSLLGTWSGPKWKPSESTLLQVLVSIQGLILGVEHPYFLEPGHGGWGAQQLPGEVSSYVQAVEDKYREGTLQHAMLDMVQVLNKGTTTTSHDRILAPFKNILQSHFFHYRQQILHEAQTYVDSLATNAQRSSPEKKASAKLVAKTAKIRTMLNSNMHQVVGRLKDEIGKLKPPITPAVLSEQETVASSLVEATATKVPDGKAISIRNAMLEAASREDYILAGQLQSELHFRERHGVHVKIGSLRRTMEEAALSKDYITAGRIQRKLQYLEQHQPRLESIQKRMFELAARQDFVRAGHFQEQHNILMGNVQGYDDDDNDDKIDRTKATNNNSQDLINTYSLGKLQALPPGVKPVSHGISYGPFYGDDDSYGDY